MRSKPLFFTQGVERTVDLSSNMPSRSPSTSFLLQILRAYKALYILNWIYRYFTEPHYIHWIRWRVVWAIGPAIMASAIRNIHAKLTNSAPAPFQVAALTALGSPPQYYE